MRIYFIGILIMCVPSINALGPEVSPRSLPNGINLPLVAQRALFLRIVEGWSKYPHAAPEYSSGDLRGAKVKAYAELAILEREQRLKDHKIVYLFDIEIDDINLEDKFMEKLLNYFRKTGIEIAVLDIMSDDPNMKLIKKFGFDYLYGEEDKDYPYESRMYLNLK